MAVKKDVTISVEQELFLVDKQLSPSALLRDKINELMASSEDLHAFREKQLTYRDADKKIVDFLVSELKSVSSGVIINWDDFYKYCVDYGIKDSPNMLTIPEAILKRCIKQAREIYGK